MSHGQYVNLASWNNLASNKSRDPTEVYVSENATFKYLSY